MVDFENSGLQELNGSLGEIVGLAFKGIQRFYHTLFHVPRHYTTPTVAPQRALDLLKHINLGDQLE